ncbi:MAG: hypothetical protein E3J72_17465 [Planctomycetota bacterium]|nr:MAG: hypothetical protein E3J72_17465 [Planctomycetota bacterium]
MRDLYKRLRIPPTSSQDDLVNILGVTPEAELRRDAEYVLLNETRKRVYDRTRDLLSRLGELRARLNISIMGNWTGDTAKDFTKSEPPISSEEYWKLFRQVYDPSSVEKKEKSIKDYLVAFATSQIGCYIIFIGALFLIVGICDLTCSDNPKSKRGNTNTTEAPKAITSDKPKSQNHDWLRTPDKPRYTKPKKSYDKPRLNIPEQSLPSHGYTQRFTRSKAIAPLRVETSYGSNYLIKLESNYSGNEVMTVFLKGGRTLEVKVPLGSYRMKYAVGDKWYGYKHFFGPNTAYYKSDSILSFRTTGRQVSGYTVTLYKVPHGNMRTTQIDKEDF